MDARVKPAHDVEGPCGSRTASSWGAPQARLEGRGGHSAMPAPPPCSTISFATAAHFPS